MKKFVCIHGHFYQPPRENPWTGEVDAEASAAPFHDWNERIAKECYEANTDAKILAPHGHVLKSVNNFSKVSFDIGPTLLSWMRRKSPLTYEAIVRADKESRRACTGHGNAMAQSYNHLIMPLASKRDQITQVVWGIRDFEFHFERKPEGMWLSETAVSKSTLKILADYGILFTVLAPHQAVRVRRIGFGERWRYLRGDAINPRQPYRVLLDRGKQFHIFFYDAPISRAIAFQGLLSSGDKLCDSLMHAFSIREREQLVSTATDGESFGHHHKFGEMAVAYGLNKIEECRLAKITNFGEFLDRFGSYSEVDIHDNSSWSCPHGVERWRGDCGCRLNFQAGWNQKWRTSLREALDYLKEIVDRVYETEAGAYFRDPWAARNDYIYVMLDPSDAQRRKFLAKNVRKTLSSDVEQKLMCLLEAEKLSLFMYTSCAWFFDDISGIEPVQILKFALRAMEIVQGYSGKEVEPGFLKILGQAKSNIPEMGSGADVWENLVKKVRPKVGV